MNPSQHKGSDKSIRDPLSTQRIAQIKQWELPEPQLPQNAYIMARLDGRGFRHHLHKPTLVNTRRQIARQLMSCGFKSLFAYTHSDEVTLCIHPEETAFGRRAHKWLSILAGEASSQASLCLQAPLAFDCRLAVCSSASNVLDYLYWRQREARRQPTASAGEITYWKNKSINGFNPLTGEATQAQRRQLACVELKPLHNPQHQAHYLRYLEDLTGNYTL